MTERTEKREMILYRGLKYQQLFDDMCELLHRAGEAEPSVLKR